MRSAKELVVGLRGDLPVIRDPHGFRVDFDAIKAQRTEAADYIERSAAPADLVLETTARLARWDVDLAGQEHRDDDEGEWVRYEDASASLAAANERAASEKKRADDWRRVARDDLYNATCRAEQAIAERDREKKRADEAEFALKVERDVTATLELMRDNQSSRADKAEAERDREAAARRECQQTLADAEMHRKIAVRGRDEAEAREATLRALSQAAVDVLAERRRQIKEEGWTPEHDDTHRDGEMAKAAACYALSEGEIRAIARVAWQPRPVSVVTKLWPWGWAWWKPSDRRRNLVRSGALILAEIERIDRAALATNSTVEGGAS
jgi:hypothetical protein